MGKKFTGEDLIDLHRISTLTIKSEENHDIPLSDFWEMGNVILIFVRHFSCIACRAHIEGIWSKKDKFRNANAQIVFVGSGSAKAIQTFKREMNIWDAPIFTDPSLKTFDAFGLKRSIANLLDPRGIKKFLELSFEGHTQAPLSKECGSHTQMGGVIALKSGKVVYHFISDYLGDEDAMENFTLDAT